MMLGALLNAGSAFEDTPLSASDFQFSNALATVDPNTGLPPVAVPVAAIVPLAAPVSSALSSWLLVAGVAAAWYFWPQIKGWEARHATA